MIENSQENPNIIQTVLQYCDIQNAIIIIETVNTAYITDRILKTYLGKLLKILTGSPTNGVLRPYSGL
jgi:negative regulator of genetic competence, sporulation and motility